MKNTLLKLTTLFIVVSIGVSFALTHHCVAKQNATPTVATTNHVKPATPTKPAPALAEANPLNKINVSKLISNSSAAGLNPKVLKAALNSYVWASEHDKLGQNKNTLTVVDFSLPSYDKRMWVINLDSNKVLMKLYTTHGKGSGVTYATHFSNYGGSEASSLGLYVTSEEYYGKHDKSMRIDGLEKGINSNARNRAIVIHSAFYATPEFVQEHHLAGRSWGCFAVDPEIKEQLLHYIKGGSALFTYAAPEDHDPIVRNGPMTI